MRAPLVLFALVAMSFDAAALADVYVLGSSYSNDAFPQRLDDSPQWHIDCAKPLQYIFDNPSSPCLASSTVWTVAFAGNQFDQISFQPVADEGITQQSDIDVIGYWMSLHPDASGVIHPTWPRPAEWESIFHDAGADHTLTNYSRDYYHELLDNLLVANPGRRFVTDRVNEMLDSIYHDIEEGIGPLTDFQQMFRDPSGHSSYEYGSYLQHNALRQAFDQPIGLRILPSYPEPEVKAYLDAIVLAYPPLPRDVDGDGVHDYEDNCRAVVNAGQVDADGDGDGDACDNCRSSPNARQRDLDADGVGNACDNCLSTPNSRQRDFDGDGVGNVCDNCRFDANRSQSDLDSDLEGDRCDLDDGVNYVSFNQSTVAEWQEEAGPQRWNSYKADLAVLRVTGVYTQDPAVVPLARRDCRLHDPWVYDTEPLLPGQVAVFLVTAIVDGSENDLGTDSSGRPRPNDHSCP